jgi:parallel beta-helix repeat protein
MKPQSRLLIRVLTIVLVTVMLIAGSCMSQEKTPTSSPSRALTPSPPVAELSITPSKVEIDEKASFSATDSKDRDGYIALYQWDFGDGSTATGGAGAIEVSHAYLTSGSYNVRLTVIDDDGLTDSKILTVSCVMPEEEPGAFITEPELAPLTPEPEPITDVPELGLATYHISATGDDVLGNGSAERPWATINYAVSRVASGSTIIVHDGTFLENVNVYKSLTIHSMNGAEVTTVQAASIEADVFTVTADNVIIRGFTINNAAEADGIHLDGVSSSTIEDNNCSNNGVGIHLSDNSNMNIIQNNTCSHNDNNGIALDRASNNTIDNNTCQNNYHGILLSHNSNNNNIRDNICVDNVWGGIGLWESNSNTIQGNNSSNNGSGIGLTTNCSGNFIEENTLDSSLNQAIFVTNSNENTIRGNICSGSGWACNITIKGDSSNNVIESNKGCIVYKVE